MPVQNTSFQKHLGLFRDNKLNFSIYIIKRKDGKKSTKDLMNRDR